MPTDELQGLLTTPETYFTRYLDLGFALQCDRCQRVEYSHHASRNAATGSFYTRGWKRADYHNQFGVLCHGRALCPDCLSDPHCRSFNHYALFAHHMQEARVIHCVDCERYELLLEGQASLYRFKPLVQHFQAQGWRLLFRADRTLKGPICTHCQERLRLP